MKIVGRDIILRDDYYSGFSVISVNLINKNFVYGLFRVLFYSVLFNFN